MVRSEFRRVAGKYQKTLDKVWLEVTWGWDGLIRERPRFLGNLKTGRLLCQSRDGGCASHQVIKTGIKYALFIFARRTGSLNDSFPMSTTNGNHLKV